MQNVGLFPNSPFYVKYVMQAAFVGGMLDMFRSSEMLFEKAYKFMATTPAQLEESERPFPYEFGFHYSYMIMIISVTLFYSTVVPIIMPVGFLFDKVPPPPHRYQTRQLAHSLAPPASTTSASCTPNHRRPTTT